MRNKKTEEDTSGLKEAIKISTDQRFSVINQTFDAKPLNLTAEEMASWELAILKLTESPEVKELQRKVFKTKSPEALNRLMAVILERAGEIMEQIITERAGEKLHKQPRGLLKTAARITGRDLRGGFEVKKIVLREYNLFGEEACVKDVLNRNSSILAFYIIKLWQENGKKPITIKNLSEISRFMNMENHDVKLCLIRLAGAVYPLVSKNERGGLTISNALLFKIAFNYSPEVTNRLEKTGAEIIKFGVSKFIKDEPIESIVIDVDPAIQKEIQGKGLGNVFVNELFLTEAKNLSDIAFKLFAYSTSNKPIYKIGELKLIRDLGLEEQRKKQGLPRIKKQIERGFQELKDKGHITKYHYNKGKKMYEFEYSDKYVKHSLHK